jgi:cytidylate kinase
LSILDAGMTFIAQAATPTPYPAYTGNTNLITPGVAGFIAIFVVALVTVFLLVDMTRRIRRSRYREEIQLKLEAEQIAADEAAAAALRKANRRPL